MVRSKLFDECVYLETKKINERDEELDIQLYNVKILNCENVFIAVGGANKKSRKTCVKNADDETTSADDADLYADIDNTLIYHLIYLMDSVDNETAVSRIGVYEITASKYQSFIDEDGDLIIDSLEPLLFKFVTSDFLTRHNYTCIVKAPDISNVAEMLVQQEEATGKQIEEEAQAGDDASSASSVIAPSEQLIDIYPNQTLEQYNEEHTRAYLSKPLEGDEDTTQWIRAYLMNEHFKIRDKGGAGDCLFYALASAINDYSVNNKGNGVPVFSTQDVTTLREIVADKVTEEDLDNYLTIYKDVDKRKRQLSRDIKKYIEEHRRISDNFKQTTIEARRKELVIENKEIKKAVKKLEGQLLEAKQMLSEFKYMKSIRTLRDFKSFIMTSSFWGDEMAIGLLQKHFNFKAIILSQDIFVNSIQSVQLPLNEGFVKNMKNIIQCGSTSLGGVDEPYFYIVLNYTGNHYQVVSYRNKESFTFKEIPFALKLAIMRGCMKSDLNAGYGKIKGFVDFRDENIELMF